MYVHQELGSPTQGTGKQAFVHYEEKRYPLYCQKNQNAAGLLKQRDPFDTAIAAVVLLCGRSQYCIGIRSESRCCLKATVWVLVDFYLTCA